MERDRAPADPPAARRSRTTSSTRGSSWSSWWSCRFVATRRVALVPTRHAELHGDGARAVLKLLDDDDRARGPALPAAHRHPRACSSSRRNLMGLVPGLVAPTANLNTTAACALIVFFSYHYIGVRKQGFVPYLKHFAGRCPGAGAADVPHRDHQPLARPLSLSLRLFGNMVAGHILLAIIFFLMGFDGLIGWALSGALGGIVVGGTGGRRHDRLHRRVPVPAEDPGGVPPGVHLLHARHALHRGAIEEAEHH